MGVNFVTVHPQVPGAQAAFVIFLQKEYGNFHGRYCAQKAPPLIGSAVALTDNVR